MTEYISIYQSQDNIKNFIKSFNLKFGKNKTKIYNDIKEDRFKSLIEFVEKLNSGLYGIDIKIKLKDIIDKKSDCELVSASGFYGYGKNTEKIKKILTLIPDLFTNETYNIRNEFWVNEILNLKIERVGGYVKECIIENNQYVQYFIKKIREIYN